MASNRSRSNRSIGNKLNNLDSRVSSGEKGTNNPHLSTDAIEGDHLVDGAVAEAKIADRAVTEDKIARGSVGTEHLGIVNTITADSGLTLKPGPDGGFVVIDGASYVPPASGSGTLYALGYNENKQVVVSTSGIGGGGGNGMASMPAGSIQPWPTRTAPTGWLVCDGSAVSRTTYADLFSVLVSSAGSVTFVFDMTLRINLTAGHGLEVGDSVFFTTTGVMPTGMSANTLYYVFYAGADYINISATRTIGVSGYTVGTPLGFIGASGSGTYTLWRAPYGIGDGSTTFNVPDIRGRTIVGRDSTQGEFNALGEMGGAKTHTLTTTEIPAHSHTGTTNSDGAHTHWISAMAWDDGNESTSGINNTQDYGLAADAGSYTSYDQNKWTGRYSSSTGSTHAHAFTTGTNGGSGGAHNNLQPYIALTYIIKHMVADGMQGPQGIQGVPGNAASVAAGTTTTGAPGSVATVTNAGTSSAAVFNFTIPRGDTGAQGVQGNQGPSGTVAVGSTSTGAEGTNAQVTNSGTSTSAILEFVIPRGNTGAGGTTSVGTVTTLSEDSSATVTNTGTPTAGVLNFGIPQGATGNNAGVKYTFSTTTTDADPGNGNIRANSTTLSSVTSLYVDNVDFAGADRTAWYTLWSQSNSPNKGYIAISQYRSTNIAVFYVNGTVTAATGYYKIPVTYVGGSLPANSAACFVSFSMSGNVGAGMQAGGSTGQILSKASNSDYDLVWVDNYADWTSQVKHKVKAAEALTLGQAVYVSGSGGTNMLVSKASNATEATSSKTMGLIMQTLATNGQGFVLTEGLISNLNTSTATLGDPVWLGTGGNLIYGLANKPVAPAHLVFIGIVTRVNNSNGEIWVKVQNGYELEELHNVKLTNPLDGQALTYEASTGLWKNSTPATNLDSLTDVTLATPLVNGQALTYDSATAQWKNATPASTLDSLTDVTITSPPVDRQVIKYDGATSQWINGAATGGVTPSDTAPLNPNNGDVWYDTAVGNMYVYSNDGNSSQWVEIQTNTAAVTTQELAAGAIMQWASATPPSNWLICDGSAVSRTTYTSLYAAIGTTYGAGDGYSTFNLPNLKGRVPVGLDASQTEFASLSQTGGAKTHTLLVSEMPSHTHVQDAHTHMGLTDSSVGAGSGWGGSNGAIRPSNETYRLYSQVISSTTATNQYTGGGGAHNNLQPYIVLNYIIKFSTGASSSDSQLATRVGTLETKSEAPIKLNLQTISANYTIPVGYNGLSAGPITIANGVTVTIPDGSAWSVV